MLEVGQWDQEDSYGAPAVYRALEPKDKNNDMVSLHIGPWRHSGANHYGYDLGALTFTGDTAREWRARVREAVLRSLAEGRARSEDAAGAHLCDRHQQVAELAALADGHADAYLPGGERRGDASSGRRRPGMTNTSATPRSRCRSFRARSTWATRSSGSRGSCTISASCRSGPDVASWKSAPLDKAVHIMGAPEVDLFASTTGTDSDWVVKLIDVYPNDVPEGAVAGREAGDGRLRAADRHRDLPRALSEEFRASRRRSSPARSSTTAGRCPTSNHVFLPGHRIMVQIQSSLFPLYDRNPQTYVDNIMYAKPGDYRKATQSIWRGGATSSAVILPVAP